MKRIFFFFLKLDAIKYTSNNAEIEIFTELEAPILIFYMPYCFLHVRTMYVRVYVHVLLAQDPGDWEVDQLPQGEVSGLHAAWRHCHEVLVPV